MWTPTTQMENQIFQIMLKAFENDKYKSELAARIRIEVDTAQSRYSGQNMSYDALTQGNVNMQHRMAASGYEVYGNVRIRSNQATRSNMNVYRSMKNKINYGSGATQGVYNQGSFRII